MFKFVFDAIGTCWEIDARQPLCLAAAGETPP